jgi:hypothetical protein
MDARGIAPFGCSWSALTSKSRTDKFLRKDSRSSSVSPHIDPASEPFAGEGSCHHKLGIEALPACSFGPPKNHGSHRWIVSHQLQRSLQGSRSYIQSRATSLQRRLRDAALGSQGREQGLNLSGGHPADQSLHDHGVESLVDPPTGLQDRGQKRPLRRHRCAEDPRSMGSAAPDRPPGWSGCDGGSRCGTRDAPRCAHGAQHPERR